jgi:7-cyano-7-deazaguanine reductase
MNTERGGPALGRPTTYPDRYDPSLLFSMDRAATREALGIADQLPFSGVDIWTAHEITWLDRGGKPQIAIAEFRIGADSPSLVESKSMKLYLGSFAQERMGSPAELTRTIEGDLASACGARVSVTLVPPGGGPHIAELPGESIDSLNVAIDSYEPAAGLLGAGNASVEEALHSALFRSTCPVTGQPDYADVLVRYRGPRIERSALLKYLVSYRRHAAFHEACVERIFIDIAERCRPDRLTVYARFLRRGGIDINPFRSNFESAPKLSERTPRQ